MMFNPTEELDKNTSNPVWLKAQQLSSEGMPIFPCNGDKTPATHHGFKDATIKPSITQAWFDDSQPMLGVPMGKITCLDIDAKHQPGLIEDFEKAMAEAGLAVILETLPKQTTVNGGCHYFARIKGLSDPIKNLKLAKSESGETIIETRGQGGYVIVAPSKGYAFERGDISSAPEITAEIWHSIVNVTKQFNKAPERQIEPVKPRQTPTDATAPGDDYNAKADLPELLRSHGWSHAGGRYWTRPGKKDGISATLDSPETPGKFYVFSSNAPHFESEQSYSPFACYAILEHSGDFVSAAKALAGQGYGQPRESHSKGEVSEYRELMQQLTATRAKKKETKNGDSDAEKDLPTVERGMENMPSTFEGAKALRPEVIVEGLAYAKSKMLIGGVAKAGKSHFVMDLVASLASGQKYLVWKPTRAFNVLYVDFELHDFEFRERTGGAFGWNVPDTMSRLGLRNYPSIRCPLTLGKELIRQEAEQYDVIILDCLYKFNQADDENSNSAMKEIGVWLDWMVARFDCTPIVIHHFGKGAQGGKDMIDRFRGASSLVGDMDAMISITNHEERDHLIVESSVRSFKQTEPFVVKWDYPKFILDESKDATKHAKPGTKRKLTDSDFLAAFPDYENAKSKLELCEILGIGDSKFSKEIAKFSAIQTKKDDSAGGRPKLLYYAKK